MAEEIQGLFLAKRMIELREKNGKSQSEMAGLLFVNKSTLSRVESGKSGYKTIRDTAIEYCKALGYTEEQIELFLRGERVVVTDTSALLRNIKNTQLINELCAEYSHVIVPTIVINELNHIKDHNINNNAARAWQILRSIGSSQNVITRDYTGDDVGLNNDAKIIAIAKNAAAEFHCVVDIITYDTDFSARLNGEEKVRALFLENYIATKQNLVNLDAVKKINDYYADDYSNTLAVLGIRALTQDDINAYLANGHTLIISTVRDRQHSVAQRKAKISWLISCGADIDKRDNGKDHFPPLSHAIQMNNLEIFKFLLHECKANPNVGSRDPHDAGKIRQKNDGNMPLMVAAWENKIEFVKVLCADKRTSLNQQDGNGFTALIKACANGFLECRDVLKHAGADTKIVDRDGKTAEDRYNEYLETGRRLNKKYNEGTKNKHQGWNRNTSGKYGNRHDR